MIVDDTPDNLKLLTKMLETQGYMIRKSLSGKMALQSAYYNPPDLILLDINMPEMNGYQVCEELKLSPRTAHIPIIFISALDHVSDKVKAFQLGGQDYITKPFEEIEVFMRVANQLTILQQKVILQELNVNLEERVKERTNELELALQQLQIEVEERKKAEAQVQKLLQKEKELSEFKSHLITSISHEFRNPLSVILMSAEILESRYDRMDQEKRTQKFETIKLNINRIIKTLDNVLAINQAESGKLNYNPSLLPLDEICQNILTEWKLINPDKHKIDLIVSSSPLPPIYFDPHLLKLILFHLLENAVRYSTSSKNVPTMKLTDMKKIMMIQICDQGLGIAREDIPQIFDKFYQGKNSSSVVGTPGIGLGLAIVKQAVDLHKGTISVESEVGQGTTFTISLPK